jgi:hypothetical protein
MLLTHESFIKSVFNAWKNKDVLAGKGLLSKATKAHVFYLLSSHRSTIVSLSRDDMIKFENFVEVCLN